MKQEILKKQTITTLENLKEKFKIGLDFKSSFTYCAYNSYNLHSYHDSFYGFLYTDF
jgi:hypothetical protein